jgi:carboxylesterase type B
MILWGQSAGANAVVTYSYGNPDDPIVRGLIADSGAAAGATGPINTTGFSTMAASFGCGNLTASEELSCIQKIDALAIQQYVADNTSGGLLGNKLGGLVADNVTVFANNTEQLLKGRVAKVVGRLESLILDVVADKSYSLL